VTRAWCALLAAGLLLSGACTGGDDAGPSPTTEPAVSTSVVDRSGIALAGVRGATTSTIVEHGTAVLTGSVQGPDGLVVGATVRIERLVAGREVRNDVLTGADGRFVLAGAPGGRYRVRAFLAPSLAQLTPEVRFLADADEHEFELVVERQSGLVVRADVAPEPPLLGGAVNLVATVASRAVGADGVVRSVPVVGATVELVGLGRWELRDDIGSGSGGATSSTTSSSVSLAPSSTTSTTQRRAPSAVTRTDAGGQVRYELRCQAAGSPGLSLRVPVTITDPTGAAQVTTETVALDLPDCVDPRTTTTTAADSSTTTPP
jgi:hypothetical protein